MWRLWSLDTRWAASHACSPHSSLIQFDRVNNHILTRTDIYQRPATARYHLTRLLGPGVLVTEGKHRRGLHDILQSDPVLDEQHKNQVGVV